MMSVVTAVSANNIDDKDEDKLRGFQKSKQRTKKMYYIGRELCFLLLIVFTTYASFNSNSSTSGGPPASPFFQRGSLVGDFYRGELADALLRASASDISFVMYYAPWDADSQVTRPHFQALALQHYKQVYFAGINCWQPRSECKRTLNKIQQFPKLVAYVTHETGVEYNGPRTMPYMSSFLEAVMRPVHRLHSTVELDRLRTRYHAVVVAYLNFMGVRGGTPYRTVYEAALRHLERVDSREVAFAVVTSFKTAVQMGADHTPSIKLYLWNETLEYSGQWSSGSLLAWVGAKLHHVTLWLSPPGVKSLTLAQFVTDGPALIMFTPLNNFVMYSLLWEVSLEYHNCHNNSDISSLAHNISKHASERISHMRRAMVSCQSCSTSRLVPAVQVLDHVWTNRSCSHDHSPLCLPRPSLLRSAMIPETDPLGAEALTDWMWREGCERLDSPPPRLPATPLTPGLRGLACRHNASLSLVALDSDLYGHFARGVGVNPNLAAHRTSVVLLHPKMETTYTLDVPITRASLSHFLVNFTEGRLERFQRTQTQAPAIIQKHPTVSVDQLTTDTFLSVAFNDSLNVVVLFHTPYCAFCHAVSHVYLSVARLLRGVPSLLFTRLDGENNDLPWQFTAPHYPSILFFPARRKAESRVLAARVGITVDSLTQFVLANLPLELRLFTMLRLCQRHQICGIERRECLVNVRREVLEALSAHLTRYQALTQRWASSPAQRAGMAQFLSRLQLLRQLQFSLVTNPTRSFHLIKSLLNQRTDPPVKLQPTTGRVKDEL